MKNFITLVGFIFLLWLTSLSVLIFKKGKEMENFIICALISEEIVEAIMFDEVEELIEDLPND